MRGERDLPVLIVAGPDLAAAVTAVTADLAYSELSVTPLGDDAEPGLAAHSVALLNRGTPSSLVTPDGTLHIALMRSCSAWPSGVWIDGGKRTAPDGSSFAWQHWSHTFEYALAAGPGDWRSAARPAGQEYNHALLVAVTSAHPGPLPGAASLCQVAGPAMLAALKPRGNPLAAGRDGTPDRSAGVTARLRDLGGRADGPVRVGLFTGISGASLTGLTEDTDGGAAGQAGDGPAVRVDDGAAVTAIGPAGTVTLALGVPPAPTPSAPQATKVPATSDVTRPEPAQPVFARYWLHGKGPAPPATSRSPYTSPPPASRSRPRGPKPGSGSPWRAGPMGRLGPLSWMCRTGWWPGWPARLAGPGRCAMTCRRWGSPSGSWPCAACRARHLGTIFWPRGYMTSSARSSRTPRRCIWAAPGAPSPCRWLSWCPRSRPISRPSRRNST